MLRHKLSDHVRHFVKRFPFAHSFYNAYHMLFSATYRSDGLRTIHNADFLKDPRFQESYQFSLTQGCGSHPAHLAKKRRFDSKTHWRTHILCWAAGVAQQLEGDFVECGVNRGFHATVLMHYLKFEEQDQKRFYLFDTFQGLVQEYVGTSDKAAHKHAYEDVWDFVSQHFGNYSNVTLVKGPVPDTLSDVVIEQVSFLHIDMNCAYPELKALEHFWPKMVPGGMIVFDDYGFRGHEEQKRLADEFAASQSQAILSLPTGQGLLVKL